MITFHATIHDSLISLFRNALLCNLRVYPFWKSPHLRVDFPELHRGACVVLNRLFESRIEICIVQEHVGVMIPPVEMSLDGLDRLNNAI